MKSKNEDIYIIELEGDSIENSTKSWIIKKTTIKMATNLFEDFDPVSSSNEKKYSLNSRAQITMKP
jgi:hypothetical protein